MPVTPIIYTHIFLVQQGKERGTWVGQFGNDIQDDCRGGSLPRRIMQTARYLEKATGRLECIMLVIRFLLGGSGRLKAPGTFSPALLRVVCCHLTHTVHTIPKDVRVHTQTRTTTWLPCTNTTFNRVHHQLQ